MAKSELQTPVNDAAISRSAAGMIAAFGRQAAPECRTIIERMRQVPDSGGEAVWRRILAAVLTTQPSKAAVRPAHEASRSPTPE